MIDLTYCLFFRNIKHLCRCQVEGGDQGHLQDQSKKHRLEKLLLIIVTIIYIVANIVYLVQKLKSFPEVQENSNIPPSLKTFLSKETFASLQKLTTNILQLSGFLSQIIISLVLLTYFISLLIKKKKVPINSVLKIFFCTFR